MDMGLTNVEERFLTVIVKSGERRGRTGDFGKQKTGMRDKISGIGFDDLDMKWKMEILMISERGGFRGKEEAGSSEAGGICRADSSCVRR